MYGMSDEEYEECMKGLGLLDGEVKKLEYVCYRQSLGSVSAWDGSRSIEQRKGLLVFTNDNMIFMEQQGTWSSEYMQALRVPLEQISGISSGGTIFKHLRVFVGTTNIAEHHFNPLEREKNFESIIAEIQTHLKDTRKERRRIAKEALAKGAVPTMVFCRFCGTRNRSDKSICENCGAPLT
jgi:hypothetical protein